MPPRQKGPWSTLATPQRASQLASAPKPTNAATLSTSSTTFESGLAVVAFLAAAVLTNYLGGSTSSLLSSFIGTWASESLRYLLLTLASCGALYGWHKRSKGGEAAAIWAGTALFALLMPRLLSFSATLFLNKGSEYISTANDIEILTRWTLTGLSGCGGVFLLLGIAMGNALYAMPAALYAPGLCSIPIIIAAPSLAVVYPYYHQCIATSIATIISSLIATTYLYTIPTTSTSSSAAATPVKIGTNYSKSSNNVHKWRLQGQLLCIFFLVLSFRTISECLHCGSTTPTSTNTSRRPENKSNTSVESSHRTGSLYRCPLKDGGFLSIIENSPEENPELRYRVLKLNHAIMGGQWVLPKREAGRPVYTTFHLQAAARLLLSESSTTRGKKEIQEHHQRPPRSLHIGLGAGTAVSVLQKKGFITDVVELYQEVIDVAQTHFGVKTNSTRAANTNISDKGKNIGRGSDGGIAFAGDALKVVPSLVDNVYDVVILDVFSGGFPTSSSDKEKGKEEPASSKLSSAAFFQEIKKKMKHSSSATSGNDGADDGGNGVLAVNYVGMQDSPELSQLICTLNRVFSTVRYFIDAEGAEGDGGDTRDDIDDKEEGREARRKGDGGNTNDDGTARERRKAKKKREHQLGNFVVMATDTVFSGGGDLFSRAQQEISELGEGPLDEMEVDVLSRLAKSELPVAWATWEACENVFTGDNGGGAGGGSNGKKIMKGAAQRSYRALSGLHNAVAHWKTMRVQFGDEVWTL